MKKGARLNYAAWQTMMLIFIQDLDQHRNGIFAAGHAYLVSKGGRVSQMLTGEHLAYTKEDSILYPAFVAFRNTLSYKIRYLPLISEFYKKVGIILFNNIN